MEDNFDGRRPFVEDDLWWKTTFGGRHPSMEDHLWGKITFGGRQPSVEYDIRWKTIFSGRQPLVDPCMLPTPLGGIFVITHRHSNVFFLRDYGFFPLQAIWYTGDMEDIKQGGGHDDNSGVWEDNLRCNIVCSADVT